MELYSKKFNPEDFTWHGLKITPIAARHIRGIMAKQENTIGVRLSIRKTGCAGFSYVLDPVHKPEKNDLIFETDGIRLYVPVEDMPFIDGTEVDFVHEGLNQLFKFHNPKAQNECGCGESFGV